MAAGVEATLVWVFVGLRLLAVAQFGAALLLGAQFHRPGVADALGVLLIAEMAALSALFLRRRTLAGAPAALADTVSIIVILNAGAMLARPEQVDSWSQAGYALLLSTAVLAGLALVRWWAAAMTGAVLAGTSLLAVCIPEAVPVAPGGTVATAMSSAGVLLGVHASARRIRTLAMLADKARQAATAAGAKMERDRHRRLLHDQATVLRLLSVAPAGSDLDTALRAQAGAGAAVITAFLTDADPATTRDSFPASDRDTVNLAAVLRRCAAAFSDLDPTVNVDLATSVSLSPRAARVVEGAVTTLLHNVRRHAHAAATTIHACQDLDSALWEITIRDDGLGFDPASTPLGYGLSQQVRAALEEIGAGVHIDSILGEGTTVRLVGPSRSRTEP